MRFNQRPGSSFRSAASRNNSVNPFVVTSKGADPAVNSLFNLNVARDATNGAFVDPNASRNGGAYQLGGIARVTSAFRMNGFKNEDISIIKNTRITEKIDLQLKFEMLNAFNRHAFGVPSVIPTDNLFGVPTTTLTTARNSQLTARIRF
ncbi:hypothetical protein [Edaphobacter modestus]|uniref:TonB-dependent transporter Oar-like beta-barrel domain-containing protein n=1 Tax=Edaphobacter modestus TaxID=388466 RepID=A0A4Q7YWT9_9BACT|nr:hypothetical protein [Edaphobacter modestus]RZU42392.1 hypothetical protein BDD14_3963 [Edaphobacter modestus]